MGSDHIGKSDNSTLVALGNKETLITPSIFFVAWTFPHVKPCKPQFGRCIFVQIVLNCRPKHQRWAWQLAFWSMFFHPWPSETWQNSMQIHVAFPHIRPQFLFRPGCFGLIPLFCSLFRRWSWVGATALTNPNFYEMCPQMAHGDRGFLDSGDMSGWSDVSSQMSWEVACGEPTFVRIWYEVARSDRWDPVGTGQ